MVDVSGDITDRYSLSPNYNVFPHPGKDDMIVISENASYSGVDLVTFEYPYESIVGHTPGDRLATISTLVTNFFVGLDAGLAAAPLPTGAATEATLLSVLSNIKDTQDVEIKLVRDTGDSDVVVQQIRSYDQDTETWTTTYEKVDGSTHTVVGPLEYLDVSAVLNLILTELQNKADLGETQPVSLASVPLATGAATETTLSAAEVHLGGIETDTGNIDTKLTGATETPTILRKTDATGSPIASGAKSIACSNVGDADGSFGGATIKAGETIELSVSHINNTLSSVAFDGTGTELLIITLV